MVMLLCAATKLARKSATAPRDLMEIIVTIVWELLAGRLKKGRIETRNGTIDDV